MEGFSYLSIEEENRDNVAFPPGDNKTDRCINITVSLPIPPLDAGLVFSSLLLGVIIFMVIFGNCLVVAAVLTTRKLRTVTNIFIVNLACADLLLGVFVLPFSAALEVLDVWVFGVAWCHIWLAIDVWLCTASILNLCCISFDRYLAITRPMKYPGLMSSKRGKLLVAFIWAVSFLICFPPLIGWNEGGEVPFEPPPDFDSNVSYIDLDEDSNGTFFIGTQFTIWNITPTAESTEDSCVVEPYECELTNAQGYRIYASMGSFYVPMLVMVFFYIRIYRAAVKTISAYEKGVLTTKTSKETNSLSRENAVTLRVHRGGSCAASKPSVSKSASSEMSPTKSNEYSSLKRERSFQSEPYTHHSPVTKPKYHRRFRKYQNYSQNGNANGQKRTERCSDRGSLSVESNGVDAKKAEKERRKDLNGTRIRFMVNGQSMSALNRRTAAIQQKQGKNLKNHMRKFNREKKAAKTLAIIVGAFILCWLPFFTIYLVGAFCEECIPALLFSVFFWLGYCNSAINPCVYALFSRDFRFAFRKLLTIRRSKKLLNKSNSEPISMQVHQIQATACNYSESLSES
ncbi:octopamine receptor 1-like [Haliotis rubra]|uniref:octopamine receptor 1-like n=1 Tax=Haliotis rubra TaxID=36100 RepID=UPI001EE5CE4A|nr:octopamine receptor 1-like [Haliotis rubra]